MANVRRDEVQVWLEETKLTLPPSLDSNLESFVSSQVLTKVGQIYNTEGWDSPQETPSIVRSAISMLYAGWYYDREYSETADTNEYALRLKKAAQELVDRIASGSLDIPDIENPVTTDEASFFPTDESSARQATRQRQYLGGPYFSLGNEF